MREIEEWKLITEINNDYYISNFGEIKRNNKILSQKKNNMGYNMVDLYCKNKRYQLLVHRLVATYFIPNINNYPCVNHKDENKQNNNVNNLEWCDYKYNNNYGSKPLKISDANSKPIVAIDKNNNKLYFKSSVEASSKIGVSSGNIYDCLYHKRNRKTAGGYKWEFV